MSHDMDTMDAEVVGGALEVVGTDSLAAITRGEIDVQISTAKQYPRSLASFKRAATEMATFDEETAESCLYSRPVGQKNGKVEYAEGLSIRMAEIVAASYGNIRVGSMIVEQTPEKVVARGVCIDLERNFASTSEVAESTVTKNGQPYSPRMALVVAKATLAKAWRDSLFKVVPRALCKPIEVEVRKLLAGDGDSATMSKRRGKVMTWVRSLGIDASRVFAALGVKGEEDISTEHLEKLTGIKTAIRDHDVTVDEAFPPLNDAGEPQAKGTKAVADKLAGKKKDKPTPEPKEEAPKEEPTATVKLRLTDEGVRDGASGILRDCGFSENDGTWIGPVGDERVAIILQDGLAEEVAL